MKRYLIFLFICVTTLVHAQTLPTDSTSFPSSPTSGSFTPTSYRYSGTTANNFRWQFYNTQTGKWIDLITLANFNNYIGTATQAAITKGGDSTLSKPKNLYDVPNKQTARKNLGTIDSATFFNPAYIDTSGASLKYLSVWFDTMAKKYQLVNNNNRAAAYQKFINRDTVKIGFFGTSIIYGLNTSGALGPGVMYGPGGPNRSAFNPPDYADTLFKRGGVPVKVMNYGRGGSEALKDFYRWDTVSTQDVVGMEFGINESTGSTTIDYKLGLYKQVINLLNKGTFVFFCLPTKTNLDPINNASKQYLISPIMQEVANTFNIPIYNAWENVTSGYGRILQSDNIHLTDLGYQRYGEGLAAFILRGETQQIYSPGTKALPEYVFNSRRPITSNGLTSSGRIVNFSVNTFDYSAFYLTAPVDVYSTIINTTTNPAYIRWVFNETTVLDTVTGNGSLKTKKLITLGAGWHFFTVRNIGAGSWGIDNIDFRSIIADNSLSPKKLEAIAGNSILGRSGTGVGDVVAITSTSNNTVPQRVGGVITWGAVNLATMVTGTLGATNGSTGQSTVTTGDLLYGSAANTWSKRAIGSAGQVLTVSGGLPVWAAPATSGTVTNVSSANPDIGVTSPTTTPVLTLNSGTGANQIVKRDGSGNIPLGNHDITGINQITLQAGNYWTSGIFSHGRYAIDVSGSNDIDNRYYASNGVQYGIRWSGANGQHSFNFGQHGTYNWGKIDSVGFTSFGNMTSALGYVVNTGGSIKLQTNTGANQITIFPANALSSTNRTIEVPDASGTLALTSQLPISGSYSTTATAQTTFTVTIGTTQANTTYKTNVTPTSLLSAAVFYVTNKTTTTFDVVFTTGITGAVSFDWSVFP